MDKTTIIKPRKSFSIEDVTELWKYRELLYFLSWKDLKIRYKQTAVGVSWALFQPFITMVIFTLFFGKLAGIPSDGVPYPIFVFVGLLFWQFFSGALSESSNALIANQSIVTKVYFPRIMLPMVAVAVKGVDFALGLFLLGILMFYYGYIPHYSALIIFPFLFAITFISALGAGLFLSAVNVKYRDVRYVLPFFIQILLFVTPVIYPTSIAGAYAWVLALNPMTGVIQNARIVLFNTGAIDWSILGMSCLGALFLFCIGLLVFKSTERYFADII